MNIENKSQSGSVLVYILIAVALFAALSYTVAGMMRGGSGESSGKEKAGIYASEIMSYARSMREAVQIMRVSNECDDSQISLANNIVSGYSHSPASSASCRLFDVNGGGLSYQKPDISVNGGLDWIFTGANDGYNIGNQCNSASCADLIAILPEISLEICKAINKKHDIAVSNGYVTQENDYFDITKFVGSYSFGARFSDDIVLQELKGKYQGCVEGNSAPQSSGKYYFYQVLIAR